MSLREQVERAVREKRYEELESVVAEEPASLRHLIRLMYNLDPEIRRVAARGIALATRHNSRGVEQVVKRLIWAMNEESGTNAAHAPEVLLEIAREKPELLVPVAPDLVRLSADITLYDELVEVLSEVVEKCPGQVGRGIADALNRPGRRQ